MKKNILATLMIAALLLLLSSCTGGGRVDTESLNTDALDTQAQQLVALMAEGDFESALKDYNYTDKLAAALKGGQYAAIWDSLIATYGDYMDIYGVEGIRDDAYYSSDVKVAFQKKCIDLRITYDQSSQIAGIHAIPNTDNPGDHGGAVIQPPDTVIERELTFGELDLQLPGTLTLPQGEGPFAAVVLVHGSGPSDRNESVGAQAPFRDIAWELAQRGIACFRYDKRTLVHGEKFTGDFTPHEETVADAALAAQVIAEQPEIDASKVVIIGHSLGAMLIPKIAEETPTAAGYIMMAAAVTPLHELMVEQYEYIFSLDGNMDANEKANLAAIKNMSENVSGLEPGDKMPAQELLNIPASYWLYLKGYNSAKAAKAISKPLLILQGEGDYQVTMKEYEAIKSTLGDKTNVTYKSYPGLSHLFSSAGDPPSPNDYMVEAHVDEAVIEDIVSFVNNQ